MAGPHDDLLTAAEHEAAQLLVTLAWRLDGGQLISADQLLAGSAPSPPMTSPWRASCCFGRSCTVWHRSSVGRRPRSLATLVAGSPAGIRRQASVGKRASGTL